MTGYQDTRRARARLVSSSIFEAGHPCLMLEPQAVGLLLYVALAVTADTAGRTEGDPVILRRQVLSEVRGTSEDEIEALLDQMEAVGVIRRYGAGSRRYVEIVDFVKDQQLKRPMPEHPDPVWAPELKTAFELIRHTIHERYGDERLYYALAVKLVKRGMRGQQVLAALALISDNHPKNPWAYLQAQGVIGRAQEATLELESQQHHADSAKRSGQGGVSSLSSVLDQMKFKQG